MKRKRLQCSSCPAWVWRQKARKVTRCPKCVLAKVRAAYLDRKPKATTDSGTYWREHPQERREYMRAWRDKNRAALRKYDRKYARSRARDLRGIAADMPCLDCGLMHSGERRIAVIARVLPCESEEIREAWPCFWKDAPGKDAGYQRLLRDLKKMGASLNGRSWEIESRRAA